MTEEKALGPVQKKAMTLRAVLYDRKAEIERALPRHITADKMLRLAMTVCTKTPKLLDCDPISVYAALLESAHLGLEVGILNQAHFVPYKGKCQFIPGYQGLMALARRSPDIAKISVPRVVREGDAFDYQYGKTPDIVHKPLEAAEPRPPSHVYAIAWIRGVAEPEFVVMTMGEVDKHRDRSPAFAQGHGPWVTDYEAMALKTVLRVLCKYLPASVELQRAVELDERAEAGLPQDLPYINGEVIDDSPPPASGVEEEGPSLPDNAESDADVASDSPSGVSEPEAGGNPNCCPGCERAHELINGTGDVPGIGHGPACEYA